MLNIGKNVMKGQDFTIYCAFDVPYSKISKTEYLVEMKGGETALYSCKKSGYYRGTGQHDWNFTFIRYVDESEIEKHIIPSTNPANDFQQVCYRLKEKEC